MPTYVEINLDAFSHNLHQVKKLIDEHVSIMAVLKSNAYGHGLENLAQIAIQKGVSCIGVGPPEEGIFLREKGISSPILALDGIIEGYEKELVAHNISSVVSNQSQVHLLEKTAKSLAKKALIHIKVDTGMNRLGIKPESFLPFFSEIISKKNISLQGVMTHFATSFVEDDDPTLEQIEKFQQVIRLMQEKNYPLPLIHAANSGAIVNYKQAHYQMVRPGIILYGSCPSLDGEKNFPFIPVMQLKSKIIHINSLKKGETVSYNRSFTAQRDTKTAILPLGYAYGYNRGLSNKACALIHGKKVNQIGIICMNLMIIDITDIKNAKIGDEVVLLGTQKKEQITVEDLARQTNTISYELLCMIGSNTKRKYIGANEN